MFDELKKYRNNDHFFFTAENDLKTVCNAPKDKSGVFIVYELKYGNIELVYIGSSGKVQNNGKINHQKGLFDRIVNLHQSGNKPLKQKLMDEEIDALDIYWYDTFNSEHMDIPVFVEAILIQGFFEVYGRLPRWNDAF